MMTTNNFTSQFSELDLPLHGVRLPSFTIENKHKRQVGVSEDVNNYDFLKAMALTGLRDLGLKKNIFDNISNYCTSQGKINIPYSTPLFGWPPISDFPVGLII